MSRIAPPALVVTDVKGNREPARESGRPRASNAAPSMRIAVFAKPLTRPKLAASRLYALGNSARGVAGRAGSGMDRRLYQTGARAEGLLCGENTQA